MFSSQIFFQTYIRFENQRAQSALDDITGHNSMIYFSHTVEKHWLYLHQFSRCFLVVWAMFSCQMFFQTYVWFENQGTQSALDSITGHNSMNWSFMPFQIKPIVLHFFTYFTCHFCMDLFPKICIKYSKYISHLQLSVSLLSQ